MIDFLKKTVGCLNIRTLSIVILILMWIPGNEQENKGYGLISLKLC